MKYKPETYFTSVEKDDFPLWKHINGYVTVVSVELQQMLQYLSKWEIKHVMLLLTLEQLEVL